MRFTLSDFADIAQILSVPVALFIWGVSRKRFVEFWRKWLSLIMAGSILFALAGLWRIGWLNWLQFRAYWPLWGLILLGLSSFALGTGVCGLILREQTRKRIQEGKEQVYELYGARWQIVAGQFRRPPVCARCLMEMKCLAKPGYGFLGDEEIWKCRQCDHKIDWNTGQKGDLLEDITARYNAEVRKVTRI